MQMTEKTMDSRIMNGVDLTALRATIGAIQENPTLASFKFRNRNEWLVGGYNRSNIKNFFGADQEDTTRQEPFVMYADEPPVLLSRDRAANPVEYLLHALAGCMTTSIIYHAAARGINLHI